MTGSLCQVSQMIPLSGLILIITDALMFGNASTYLHRTPRRHALGRYWVEGFLPASTVGLLESISTLDFGEMLSSGYACNVIALDMICEDYTKCSFVCLPIHLQSQPGPEQSRSIPR